MKRKLFIIVLLPFLINICVPDHSYSGFITNGVKKIIAKFKRHPSKSTRSPGKTIGGSSAILAERLGIATKKGWAAHHLIPCQLKNHHALKKVGMDMDEISNGIALPTKPGIDPKLPLHRGSHPGYTAAVAKELDDIPRNTTVEETRRIIAKIQKKFGEKLKNGKPLHEKYGAKDPWY